MNFVPVDYLEGIWLNSFSFICNAKKLLFHGISIIEAEEVKTRKE